MKIAHSERLINSVVEARNVLRQAAQPGHRRTAKRLREELSAILDSEAITAIVRACRTGTQ